MGGVVSNSHLELAAGLLQLEALAQTFAIRERTLIIKGENLSTTSWDKKGSTTTTNSASVYLLRLYTKVNVCICMIVIALNPEPMAPLQRPLSHLIRVIIADQSNVD